MGYFSDDEDEDWAEWLKLSDEQAEAIVQAEEKRYSEWYDRLTPLQQYRLGRRSALDGCMVWRRFIRAGWDGDFFREQLRARQNQLLKLRIWRATGQYPSSA